MKQRPVRPAVLIGLILLTAACGQEKSRNPLSPLIAGPIAGVSITAPVLLEPQSQQEFPVAQQPLTLLIENASSNGERPVRYHFQLASDALFLTPIHQNTQVTPGANGRTAYQLPDTLAPERTYYWRVKADDGANASDFSAVRSFRVFTPVVIQAPVLLSPSNGATIVTRRPALNVQNVVRTGPAGAITYLFEGGDTPAFGVPGLTVAIAESQSGTTSFQVSEDLPYAKLFFWRVRASDPGHTGPWSETFTFTTPQAPAPPPPPPGPGPAPGPGGPAPGDELNLNTVQWVKGEHIGNWAVTSTLTGITTNGEDLCTNHTKAGQWPILGFFDIPGVTVEGNQILIANINGTWHGGAGEWLRPGQVCKHVGTHIGENVFYDSPPLQYWTPRRGETVGIAVSTPSRAGQWGTAERSNVRLIVW